MCSSANVDFPGITGPRRSSRGDAHASWDQHATIDIVTHIIVFGDLNAASKLSPVLNVRLNCLGTSAPVIERSFSVTVITTGAVTSALKILTAADEIIPQ